MATVELIDSVVLGSQTTYITFDSIPATYQDLTVIGQVRNATTASGLLYLTCRINNSSSTSTYAATNWYSYWSGGSHSTGYNQGATSDTFMKLGRMASGNSATSWGTVGGVDVKAGVYSTFYNYADTGLYTSCMSFTYGLQKATATLFQTAGGKSTTQYMNTSAISKIEFGFHFDSCDFTAGSNLYLYGINGP